MKIMQQITLISLYNEICLDLRYTSAMFRHDHHQTNLLLFKSMETNTPSAVPEPQKQEAGGFYGESTYATPHELQLLLQTLNQQNPHLIVFYFSSDGYGLAQFFTDHIKNELHLPVLWAGEDSTRSPNENILRNDMICIGEAEYPLRLFVERMERGEIPVDVPGVWINRDGTIHRNPMALLESRLDNFPFPDFENQNKSVIENDEIHPSLFPRKSRFHTHLAIHASRTCPFTCPHCGHSHDDLIHNDHRAVRLRSPDNVIDEIRVRMLASPTPIRFIEFLDENFPLDHAWIEPFVNRYPTEVALPFSARIQPAHCDPDILQLLRNANLMALTMQIPSAGERILRKYFNFPYTREQIIQTAKQIMNAGIKLLIELCSDNPFETEEDRKATLELLCELPKGYAIVESVPYAFYPNCTIHENAFMQGLLDKIEQPTGCHAFRATKTSEYDFWRQLHKLAHFAEFDKPTLMEFAKDGYLRRNPGILQEMLFNLYHCHYLNGNPAIDKEQFIQHLRIQLAQAENNTLTRALNI
ncbi:MAG: radical SAM protein [Candidatus Omnitrophota bacterium]|jgi:hypothetical protein|nr:MAG: radical SAM protein [Candidatus Omnitrophota bacterium]